MIKIRETNIWHLLMSIILLGGVFTHCFFNVFEYRATVVVMPRAALQQDDFSNFSKEAVVDSKKRQAMAYSRLYALINSDQLLMHLIQHFNLQKKWGSKNLIYLKSKLSDKIFLVRKDYNIYQLSVSNTDGLLAANMANQIVGFLNEIVIKESGASKLEIGNFDVVQTKIENRINLFDSALTQIREITRSINQTNDALVYYQIENLLSRYDKRSQEELKAIVDELKWFQQTSIKFHQDRGQQLIVIKAAIYSEPLLSNLLKSVITSLSVFIFFWIIVLRTNWLAELKEQLVKLFTA